jgi:Ca-activated chloride channel family protein
MEGTGERELEEAMAVLLDPEQSARYLLQPSSRDVTVVIPFDDEPIDQWRTDGNDPRALRGLLDRITAQDTGGGTAIYRCLNRALDVMAQASLEGYEPAIVLMTDGRSNDGSFDDFEERLAQGAPGTVPVYGILFGDASEDQLTRIAEATSGRVFDGRDDLIGALRDAKGNN